MLATTVPTIRQVAELVGQMVGSFPGVEYGKLYYRLLDNEKSATLATAKGSFEATMSISGKAREDLTWWIDNLHDNHRVSGYHTAILLSLNSQMPVGLAVEVSATNSPRVATGHRLRRPFT